MRTVILCDNEGNKLRPITCTMPRAMLPVLGRPVAEHTVRLLRRHKVHEVSIIADYMSGTVSEHFENNPVSDVNIAVTDKSELKNIPSEESVLVISGSIVTDTDIEKFIEFHEKKGADVTVASKTCEKVSEYGSVIFTSDGKIMRIGDSYDEERGVPKSFNMGMMLVSGRFFEKMPDNIWDIPAIAIKEGASVFAYNIDGYVSDISDIDAYMKCHKDFLDKKINLPFPCDEKEPGVWIDKEAAVARGAVIVPPIFIGKGSKISRGARIEAYSSISENAEISSFASVKRSVLLKGAHIDEGGSARGCVMCENSRIGYESAAYEGSVIGYNSILGKHCILRPSVRIWPDKYIEDEMCIGNNVVWESGTARSFFSDGYVSGMVNRDITPEFAAETGCAAAKILSGKIAVSGDRSGASVMIKNALISGLQSGGTQVYDFGEQPLPITRSGIRFYSLDGGLAISTCVKDGGCFASIDIINGNGADLESDKLGKIENAVSSGEPMRINAADIKDIEYLFEYKLYYLKQLINSTSRKTIGARLLIQCSTKWAEELLRSAASDLDCNFVFTDKSPENGFCGELTSGNYDFGALIDYKCEQLTLVTKAGKVISEFDYAALTALIIMKSYPSAVIYTPESSPDSIEIMASEYGACVNRTKLSPPKLMNELSKSEEKMFVSQFIYRFDAVGALIMLLDYLSENSVSLEKLISEIPSSYTVSTSVTCAAGKQSDVMQKIATKNDAVSDDIEDGIRVDFDKGWVLIVPRRSQSAIRVISHGFTEEYAREIADICTDRITE